MKIYVGNLANSVTEQELTDLFVSYGDVISARIIKDKFSGESRGFGFVEMEDEEANAAISSLNGFELKGNRLRVSEARPPEEKSGFGGGANRRPYSGGNRSEGGNRSGGDFGSRRYGNDDRNKDRFSR